MRSVLTLNGGSSSIRFALYDAARESTRLLAGKLDRIGLAGTTLTIDDPRKAAAPAAESVTATDHGTAAAWLLDRLSGEPLFASVIGVGHRVVHGMQHSQPERITPVLLDELKAITPYDPEHLPREIELIEKITRLQPEWPQVACFDTAFHRSMPPVATLLPIPRRYFAKGVQRYGFHGLSYTFLMRKLASLDEGVAARGRVILAHLGNGASLAAVQGGHSIDTSMGFTPASGIMMSTRSGDLDPGIVGFLALTESMDARAFEAMVSHESGLLGVSETGSDVRDLLARELQDPRAAEAVELFCYQVRKCIGSFAAALGGLDALVFAGGIGENAPQIRARICAPLGFLGIDLDAVRNARGLDAARGEALISTDAGRVPVRVIRTDEEAVIAAATVQLLGLTTNGATHS
jgi:acetate kinase